MYTYKVMVRYGDDDEHCTLETWRLDNIDDDDDDAFLLLFMIPAAIVVILLRCIHTPSFLHLNRSQFF